MKNRQNHFFQKLLPSADNALLFATVTAVAVHALFIFAIEFEDKSSPAAAVQEVTTVLTENLQKNEKADFIANASQPNQQVLTGTLEDIVAKQAHAQLPAPAILIMGNVVKLHQTLGQHP